MKELSKKIKKEYEAYEEIRKKGDDLYERWLDLDIEVDEKEMNKQYKRIKRSELARFTRLIRSYFMHFAKNDINYEDFLKNQIQQLLKEDLDNRKVWIIITFIQQKRPTEDLSLELCGICKRILDQPTYTSSDEHHISNLTDLLHLWKNPVQIPILKEVILKEPNYEFKTIGKAISYLKEMSEEQIATTIAELKESEKYQTDEAFRNNIEDHVPVDFWWTI